MTVKNIHTQLLLCDFESIKKDSKNPHFKNEYASLPNILSVVVPVLKQAGIVLSSSVSELHSDMLVITLTHAETSTSVSSHVKLLNMTDMQKWGACITYATRYGLLSLLGISADMDDDGNSTVPVPAANKKADPAALNQLKAEIKQLWATKKEHALKADKDKATRVEGMIDLNFMKADENGKLFELHFDVLLSIKNWLQSLSNKPDTADLIVAEMEKKYD